MSRWPVAGPSKYWLIASSSASKVKNNNAHIVQQIHITTHTQDNYNNTRGQPTTITRNIKLATIHRRQIIHRPSVTTLNNPLWTADKRLSSNWKIGHGARNSSWKKQRVEDSQQGVPLTERLYMARNVNDSAPWKTACCEVLHRTSGFRFSWVTRVKENGHNIRNFEC